MEEDGEERWKRLGGHKTKRRKGKKVEDVMRTQNKMAERKGERWKI